MQYQDLGQHAITGPAKCVVLDMTAGLHGHNITCGHFFTSKKWPQRVQSNGTSPNLLPYYSPQRTGLHFNWKFSSMKTVLYYSKRNKDVPLISRLHINDAMSTREEKKPSSDLDYNRNKGGVNNLEKVCYFLSLNFHHHFLFYFFKSTQGHDDEMPFHIE